MLGVGVQSCMYTDIASNVCVLAYLRTHGRAQYTDKVTHHGAGNILPSIKDAQSVFKEPFRLLFSLWQRR